MVVRRVKKENTFFSNWVNANWSRTLCQYVWVLQEVDETELGVQEVYWAVIPAKDKRLGGENSLAGRTSDLNADLMKSQLTNRGLQGKNCTLKESSTGQKWPGLSIPSVFCQWPRGTQDKHRLQFKSCNWSWKCYSWRLSANCTPFGWKAVLSWMESLTAHNCDYHRCPSAHSLLRLLCGFFGEPDRTSSQLSSRFWEAWFQLYFCHHCSHLF